MSFSHSDLQLAWDLNAALLLAVVAGLVLRARARLCGTFAVYVALAFVVNRLITLWPGTFWNYDVWHAKETAYSVLYQLMAWEVAALTFAGLPRARTSAFCLLAVIAVVTVVAVHGVGGAGARSYWVSVGVLQPRGQGAAIWPLVAVAAVATYHRVPMHWFHRMILLGLACNLSLSAGVLEALGKGTVTLPFVQALEPAAYTATCSIWAWAAWRAPEPTALSLAARQRLRPWA